MEPIFSDEMKRLIAKKPLERDEMIKLKKALVQHAKDYLNPKKGANNHINLTNVIINDLKVADHNPPFIRDVAVQLERSRDYSMYENKRDDGSTEIIVKALDRPLIEKHSTIFLFVGIFFGWSLSQLDGLLQHREEPKLMLPTNIEVIKSVSDDSVTNYRIETIK